MSQKSCTICAGTLVYGPDNKDCFRCDGLGTVSHQWIEPDDPDFELIRKVARDAGYMAAVHGSKIRDFDIIAVPWTEDAVGCRKLLSLLCTALNGKILARDRKPHARYSFNIQVDGYVKLIDISVMPTLRDVPAFPYYFERTDRAQNIEP